MEPVSPNWSTNLIKPLPLTSLSLKYEKFRLTSPKGHRLVEKTMREIGQVSPICVSPETDKAYAILDGFKRYQAAKSLQYDSLLCRILQVGLHAQKAAIAQLNHTESSIHVIEESLIIVSLHREDGLSQTEIAVLFGRHKSWVCRRLSVAERLCDEAIENLRLSLITFAIARELARLPRGNQPKVLACILKHRFTSRETTQLVDLLLSEPAYSHDKILYFPEPILDARNPPKPGKNSKDETIEDWLMSSMALIRKGVERFQKAVSRSEALHIPDIHRKTLIYQLTVQEQILGNLKNKLNRCPHAAAAY